MLNLLILIPLFAAVLVMLGGPARKLALTAAAMQAIVAVLALVQIRSGDRRLPVHPVRA